MAYTNNQFFADIERDIIDLVNSRAQYEASYQAFLEVTLPDPREMDRVIQTIATLYDILMDGPLRDHDSGYVLGEAVFLGVGAQRALLLKNIPNLQRDVTNQEYDEITQIARDYNGLRGTTGNARPGNYGGYARRPTYGQAGGYNSRPLGYAKGATYAPANKPVQYRTAYNGTSAASSVSTNPRVSALAKNAEAVPAQNGNVYQARRPVAEEARRTQRATGAAVPVDSLTDSTPCPDAVCWLRTMDDISRYPLHPQVKGIPQVNYITHALRAYLDKDGFVNFQVLERNKMHQQDHETLLISTTQVYKSRQQDYRNSDNVHVKYSIGKYQVDPAQVENKYVENILDEMVAKGEIKEGSTFMQLTEEQRSRVLNLAATAKLKQIEQSISAKRRAKMEAIEQGKAVDGEGEEMEIVSHKQPKDVGSPKQAVSMLLSFNGDMISHSHDHQLGYLVQYNTISVLRRCKSPDDAVALKGLLEGFKLNNTQPKSVHFALASKSLPLEVFNQLNTRCVNVLNYGLRTIVGLSKDVVTDFVEDFPKISQWLIQKIEAGEISDNTVNHLYKYFMQQVAKISGVDSSRIKTFYPHLSEIAVESVRANCIFEVDQGNVLYVPMLAAELGLSSVRTNVIAKKDSPIFNHLIDGGDPTLRNLSSRDYLCTSDNQFYRIVLNTDMELILEFTQVS